MTASAVPEFETLVVSVDGPIARITMNQPHKLNPVGLVPLRELADAAAWVDTQRQVTVTVLTGAGERAFSAGFDLTEFGDASAAEARGGADLGARMADAIEAMESVTIAAIHGHCVGGGLVVAAACDLRIAADNTRFAIPEVDLGIPLAWGGIPRLVREIGPAATRDLVMTCRPFGADEAVALGFVNRVVARDDLAAQVDTLAESLAAKAPMVIKATKRQVNNAIDQVCSARDGWIGQPLLDAALADPQARAAARAYLANRK